MLGVTAWPEDFEDEIFVAINRLYKAYNNGNVQAKPKVATNAEPTTEPTSSITEIVDNNQPTHK